MIRFSSIGDIVLTSPVVRGLHRQLGAEVHFLTKPQFAGLLSASPYIDRIHTLPDSFAELVDALRAYRFDQVIDLHNNLRTWRLRASLTGPRWHRFDKLNLGKWLLVNANIDRLPKLHIVDRYLAAAAPLGLRNDGKGLDYFLPDKTEWPPQVTDLHQRRFVAVAVGAAHATKQIPIQILAEILAELTAPIVLLGGLGDHDRAAALVTSLPKAGLYDLVGKLSLHQSALVVQQAAVLLTPDTGLMHIAAALETPIVSVWGNTVPEFGMYPYRPGQPGSYSIHEVEGLSCRPCSKIGHAACPKGHFRCMMKQEVGAIVVQLERILERPDGRAA